MSQHETTMPGGFDDSTRAVLNSAPTNLLLCDDDLRVAFANEGSLRTARDVEATLRAVTGKGADAIVGSSLREWSPLVKDLVRALEQDPDGVASVEIDMADEVVDLRASVRREPTGNREGYAILWRVVTQSREQQVDRQGQLDAIGRSQAVIEFDLDGTIRTANENFCKALGYTLEEIQGKHHSMFVPPGVAETPEYAAFWKKLASGEYDAGEYRRIRKDGSDLWIQASYNPIFDRQGSPYKVVKYAADVTEQKLRTADYQGQIAAIGKSQAVIEFDLDGTIRTANENFCKALGYTLEEIQGKHHSMFAPPGFAQTAEYAAFWQKLGSGQFDAGEYKRIRKGGGEIWIQASYNPIFDANGKPFKVVKYATDVTAEKLRNADYQGQLAAIDKAQAIIEFDLDGTIRSANDNFLAATGYTLGEIRGQHHRIFVDPAHANSPEYSAFWARLARGQYDAGEYKRFRKNGDELWIQASYNPILDLNGKAFKVVKYASDITAQKHLQFKVQRDAEELKRRVEDILVCVKAVANGDLTATHGVTGDDPLGQLGEGLTKMIEDLRTMIERDQRASEELRAKVDELLQVVRSASEGDLTVTHDVRGDDPIGQLGAGLSRMIDDLRSIIVQIKEGSEQFNGSARTISDTASHLAEATQANSSTVEEMTASIGELTESIGLISSNADEANQIASSTSASARTGGEAVDRSIAAMEEIQRSSEKIAEIIQVISEIASQTNLLALNAAIEAARAGEHGLGFAVVADEVRKLAERSSEAAKQITTLIRESTGRVGEGTRLSRETGVALRGIIDGVEQTADSISKIASATTEQSATAGEVSRAIQNVSQVTENNSANSEEMASSAEELSAQAAVMRDLVARFVIS